MLGVDVDSLAQIQLPKYLRNVRVFFATKFFVFHVVFAGVPVLNGKKPEVMRKKGFLKEHACAKSRPRKGTDLFTVRSPRQKPMPKQRHLGLSKRGVEDGATVSKKIS
jgi:hypothetical protein